MIFLDVVSNDNKPVEVFSDCQSNNITRGASSSEYDTKNTPGSLLASVVRNGLLCHNEGEPCTFCIDTRVPSGLEDYVGSFPW